MEVYSVTELSHGCYGVYSTLNQATSAAMKYIAEMGYDNAEETIWDGFHKSIYYHSYDSQHGICGECIEIQRHKLDDDI